MTLDDFNLKWGRYAKSIAPNGVTFTGWKGSDNNLVGQWVDYRQFHGPYFYVNMPNMIGGEFARDDTFDIGISRVCVGTPDTEIKIMLDAGLAKLLELSGV